MNVLLLEDDTVLAEIIEEYLHASGHTVTRCYDGLEAETAALKGQFGLMLLDINTPGQSGLELLASLRALKLTTPIILITADQRSDTLKKALEQGADEYIKKPFDLDELQARIDHLLRRQNHTGEHAIPIGTTLTYHPGTMRLKNSNGEQTLKKKESQILNYLLEHQNRIISHEELVNNIWSYEEPPTDSTLRSYIKTLRRLVGKERIVTIKGEGYRFDQV